MDTLVKQLAFIIIVQSLGQIVQNPFGNDHKKRQLSKASVHSQSVNFKVYNIHYTTYSVHNAIQSVYNVQYLASSRAPLQAAACDQLLQQTFCDLCSVLN